MSVKRPAHRACENCIKLKVKCTPRPDEDDSTCQRCHRLQKSCFTPAAAPPKRQRQRSDRIAQLEQRIDDLTKQLQEKRTPPAPPSAQILPTPPLSVVEHSGPQTTAEEWAILENDPQKVLKMKQAASVPPIPLPRPVQMKLFNDFRSQMLQYFPFIALPVNADARAICTQRPFLFKSCVVTACHRDPAMQRQMSQELIRTIAQRVLVDGEKNIDLLQGVLVFIAWYHMNLPLPSRLFSVLSIATALTVDLGLNRPNDSKTNIRLGVETVQIIHGRAIYAEESGVDGFRALLACYYISSTLAACYRKFEPIAYTQYVSECFRTLASAQEWPADLFLLNLVRLRRTVDKYISFESFKPSCKIPTRDYVRCFQEELQGLRQEFLTTGTIDSILELEITGAEICLYESIIGDECDITLHKLEALHACLEQINHFFGVFSALPVQVFSNLPFLGWTHYIHALIVLAKLSFLSAPNWDLEHVRSTTNFSKIIDQVNARFEEVLQEEQSRSPSIGPGNAPPRFKIFLEKQNRTKAWFEAKIQAEAQALRSLQPANPNDPLCLNHIFVDDLMNGFDEWVWDGVWSSPFLTLGMSEAQ